MSDDDDGAGCNSSSPSDVGTPGSQPEKKTEDGKEAVVQKDDASEAVEENPSGKILFTGNPEIYRLFREETKSGTNDRGVAWDRTLSHFFEVFDEGGLGTYLWRTQVSLKESGEEWTSADMGEIYRSGCFSVTTPADGTVQLSIKQEKLVPQLGSGASKLIEGMELAGQTLCCRLTEHGLVLPEHVGTLPTAFAVVKSALHLENLHDGKHKTKLEEAITDLTGKFHEKLNTPYAFVDDSKTMRFFSYVKKQEAEETQLSSHSVDFILALHAHNNQFAFRTTLHQVPKHSQFKSTPCSVGEVIRSGTWKASAETGDYELEVTAEKLINRCANGAALVEGCELLGKTLVVKKVEGETAAVQLPDQTSILPTAFETVKDAALRLTRNP